jgi:hypothetical protein
VPVIIDLCQGEVSININERILALMTDGGIIEHYSFSRMSSSGMSRRVNLVRTVVSEERIAYVIKVTRILFLCNVRRLLVRLTLFLVHLFLSP